MTVERLIWISAGVLAAVVGAFIALGASGAGIVVLALFGLLVYWALGWWMRRPVDTDWLPTWVVVGFIAKLGGTVARYVVLHVIYSGGGDSARYYEVGRDLATIWTSGSIPRLTGNGGFGTQITEWLTGAMFAVFTPDRLGGFVIFATIAYVGQLGLYAAFRRWAPARALKLYAFGVLFLPTYAFWPSSIGKDALILAGLGIAAYCAARALEAYEFRWLAALATSLGLVAVIRIHIAVLFVAALLATALIAKMPDWLPSSAYLRRIAVLATLAAATVFAASLVPGIFGIDISSVDDVDAFAQEIVRRTSERGTVASGDPVTGIEDVPGAIALVLFRPYAFEASELQHLMAAAETTVILGLTIWLAPRVIRNWRAWRPNAYVVFCTVYTLGFSVAFSTVRNLGIIARQRGQVLAFFLVILLALAFHERAAGAPEGVAAEEADGRQPDSLPVRISA